MKYFTLLIGLLFAGLTHAQTEIMKSSISSGGGSAEVGNKKMVFALGEVAIREMDVGNIHLSEGFVGPDIAQIIMNVEDYELLTGFSVYPSPVKTTLNIRFDSPGNYEVSLFDLTGKLLLQTSHENTARMQTDMRKFTTGLYILIIKDPVNKKAVSLKIQKQ